MKALWLTLSVTLRGVWMELDWHASKLNKRRDTYYVVITVPKEVRGLLGGPPQRRLSTGTSDLRIAERRQHDLEAELRRRILADVEKARLVDPQGDYRHAIATLGLTDAVYAVSYDAARDDIVETTFSEPPTSKALLDQMEKALLERLAKVRTYRSECDPEQSIQILEDFRRNVPLLEEAEAAAAVAMASARRANGVAPVQRTLSSLVPLIETQNARLVEQGSLKHKSAKQRVRHLKQFIEIAGDHALVDLEPKHAYAYAAALGEDMGNSTIKTRVSDVRVALRLAVEKGLLKINPFENLNLKGYGTGTKHYDPLSDEQIHALVDQPGLPDRVRNIWLILACTGMRLDEVATLRHDQVRQQDGMLYFELRHAAVKNQNSRRRVPICEALVPLVRKLLKDTKGQELLFDYKLNADGKTRASTQVNYWFAKAGVGELPGVASGRYATHSLRGTLKDKLRDVDVPSEISKSIVGHGLGGMEDSYGHGYSLRKLKEAVDKVPHPYLTVD